MRRLCKWDLIILPYCHEIRNLALLMLGSIPEYCKADREDRNQVYDTVMGILKGVGNEENN